MKMRAVIHKIGRLNTVIIITVISIIASNFLTFTLLSIFEKPESFAVYLFVSALIPLIIAPLCAWPLVSLLMKIHHLEKKMRKQATFDYLTGFLTRRAFLQKANEFIDVAKQEKITFSVIALDIDNFKEVNDRYGHAGGDDVLKHFAKTMKTLTRKSDLIGRLGGEEFTLLLPDTTEETAVILSDRLHQAIREAAIQYDDATIQYTVSMGLVSITLGKFDCLHDILKTSDKLLYLAKTQGRDQTVLSKKMQ